MTETNTIEIRLSSIEQLFDTLDPSPFREKDVDKDVEEFIVGCSLDARTLVIFPPIDENAGSCSGRRKPAAQARA